MTLTRAEIKQHNTRQSCWVAIHGAVYDVTEFLDAHPGGATVILRCAGKDATDDFDSVHSLDVLSEALPAISLKGQIDPSEWAVNDTSPTQTQKDTESEPKGPPPLATLINLHDFEQVAKKYLPANAWAYYSSGADDEISKRNNARAYQKVALRPRILKSIPSVDTTTFILGYPVSLPVYMSPVGLAKFAHPDGECALARAAGKEGLVQVLANSSSMPVEQVRDARTLDDQPLFFQLYVNRDISKSVDLVKRALKAGVRAIWITVDSPVVGKREMDERLNLAVVCVEDAVLAYQHGVQGIVLSNHGGRSQDTAQSPLLTLLEIRKFAPMLLDGNMQIFIDGGIRRGTDVLKAIALGATAVGLGRPFLFSMSGGYGEAGVRRMLAILRQEIETNMVFLGAKSLNELQPEMVNASRLERDLIGSVKL
ncbi:hypothetical protein N7462_009779 [Penicillium macrosclerotiorum]|uniref:uncharacterized protein n=1 Tax=Penicillium macrosclerotiorum TaxID=303699 RepID=UPI002546E956|nr:uncharacterized protein N7462_009779 [Penicillium macrosclerotiorum]KAJ5668709.1 hypothetical protein N7462_009779 [Penicillium macrosclerotiorum]